MVNKLRNGSGVGADICRVVANVTIRGKGMRSIPVPLIVLDFAMYFGFFDFAVFVNRDIERRTKE